MCLCPSAPLYPNRTLLNFSNSRNSSTSPLAHIRLPVRVAHRQERACYPQGREAAPADRARPDRSRVEKNLHYDGGKTAAKAGGHQPADRPCRPQHYREALHQAHSRRSAPDSPAHRQRNGTAAEARTRDEGNSTQFFSCTGVALFAQRLAGERRRSRPSLLVWLGLFCRVLAPRSSSYSLSMPGSIAGPSKEIMRFIPGQRVLLDG